MILLLWPFLFTTNECMLITIKEMISTLEHKNCSNKLLNLEASSNSWNSRWDKKLYKKMVSIKTPNEKHQQTVFMIVHTVTP